MIQHPTNKTKYLHCNKMKSFGYAEASCVSVWVFEFEQNNIKQRNNSNEIEPNATFTYCSVENVIFVVNIL